MLMTLCVLVHTHENMFAHVCMCSYVRKNMCTCVYYMYVLHVCMQTHAWHIALTVFLRTNVYIHGTLT